MKMECKEVRKLILGIREGEPEPETNRRLSEHLSICTTCSRLCRCAERLDGLFISEKLRLERFGYDIQAGKNRVLSELARSGAVKGVKRLRVAWAGAVLLLALGIFGAVAIFPGGKDRKPAVARVPSPRVTQSVAAAASLETVREVAQVIGRNRAPSLELPYSPARFSPAPFVPGLLNQCALQSAETLAIAIESKTNLTRRNET
jgi:hypothetical protein